MVLNKQYKSWKESIINCFLEGLRTSAMKNIKWDFAFLENIFPENETGKLLYFKNNLNQL